MKVVIQHIIKFLKSFLHNLEQTYDMTWGCNDLAEEFKEELNIRKSINKENFIGFAAGILTFEAAKKGILLSEDLARRRAEEKFDEGIKEGHFDELYKLKGENDESK